MAVFNSLPRAQCWAYLAVMTLILGLSGGAAAQQAAPKAGAEKEAADADAVPPPLDDRYRPHIAATEVVGMGDPITVIAMIQRGLQGGVWMGKPTRGVLIDKDKIAGVEDKRPLQGMDEAPWEWRSYCNLIVHARDVPLEALAKAARKDVFYPNLMSEPANYRADPIHLQGRMGRLIKVDAPVFLRRDGVRHLYEGWIYPDEKNVYTVYEVIFTELPKNAELGEKVRYYIDCDAFFFKIVRYDAPDKSDPNKKVRRDAPMFIGRTFALTDPPKKAGDDDESPFAGTLIPAILILVGSLIGLFFVLTWFFRRGDRKVQSRIREARNSEFVEPPPDSGPVNGSSRPAGEKTPEEPRESPYHFRE